MNESESAIEDFEAANLSPSSNHERRTIQAQHTKTSILKVATLEESINSPRLVSSNNHGDNRADHHPEFGTVEIREHAYILGCNPSVKGGPPLTIEWKSMGNSIESIDDFEARRSSSRRPDWMIRKSSTERHNLLKDEGFTSAEISLVVDEIDQIQASRKQAKEDRGEFGSVVAEARRRKMDLEQHKKTVGRAGLWGMFRRHKVPVWF